MVVLVFVLFLGNYLPGKYVNKETTNEEVLLLASEYNGSPSIEVNGNVPYFGEEEYTTESVLIAKFIMEGLDAQIGKQSKSRGIKAEEWFVVRNAHMPSVLVEAGFITNEKEAALLDDAQYLQKITQGIYNGLSSFISHFELSRGFTGTE